MPHHEVGGDGRGARHREERRGHRPLAHHLDRLAPLAGLDHGRVVVADAEPLRHPRAPVEVEGAHRDVRLGFLVEREQVRHLAPERARLARVEERDAHVAREPAEDLARVGREREAALGRQIEPVRMERRERQDAAQDRRHGRDLHAQEKGRAAHQRPRQARAPR